MANGKVSEVCKCKGSEGADRKANQGILFRKKQLRNVPAIHASGSEAFQTVMAVADDCLCLKVGTVVFRRRNLSVHDSLQSLSRRYASG